MNSWRAAKLNEDGRLLFEGPDGRFVLHSCPWHEAGYHPESNYCGRFCPLCRQEDYLNENRPLPSSGRDQPVSVPVIVVYCGCVPLYYRDASK